MSDAQAEPVERICPECRYDLRGISNRCPECGLDLSFIDADESCIPWCNPNRAAPVGFVQTVFLSVFRTKLVLRELYRPVDYRAAQWFRFLCVLIGWAALHLGAWQLNQVEPEFLRDLAQFAGPAFPIFLSGCLLLLIVFITGVPSYMFHPKHVSIEHQNRAIALSYYASAPLAIVPLLIPLMLLSNWADDFDRVALSLVLLTVVLLLTFALLLGLYYRFVQATVGRDWYTVRATLGILFGWGVSAALCLVVLPLVYLYVSLVYYTFVPL